MPVAAVLKPSRLPAGSSAVRTSTVAPGVVVVTVTPTSVCALPRSKTMPTPFLRLPKCGEPRYSSVDQAVDGLPS